MHLRHASAIILLVFRSGLSHAQLDEDIILRRHAEIEARFADSPIQGVRKMSEDEGEKFFFEYWQFEQALGSASGNDSTNAEVESRSLDHHGEKEAGSPPAQAQAQVLARSHPLTPSFSGLADPGFALRSLFGRDFKCPTGTNACLSINRSDRCCGTGDTCEVIRDTGYGTVGCCPKGQSCSERIGSCQSGYTACSKALGGGCCIPGFACVEGGCAYTSVVTVTEDNTVTTSTITYSTQPQDTHSASTGTTTTTSNTSRASTTSTASTAESASTATGTDSLGAPGRPIMSTTTTGTHTANGRTDLCPTGFYACSAVYQGGCCQTGRNCDTTSCPTTQSTTFTSNGKTIVAPVATGNSASRSGKCAQGWFRCSDTAGGGCCPQEYVCGASCTATGSAATTVAKEQPTGEAHKVRVSKVMAVVWMVMKTGISFFPDPTGAE
ncbi:unnamed protein product [Penicillium manginii]